MACKQLLVTHLNPTEKRRHYALSLCTHGAMARNSCYLALIQMPAFHGAGRELSAGCWSVQGASVWMVWARGESWTTGMLSGSPPWEEHRRLV